MCCVFTCCGWIIDLIQRLWTFTMSCCISSAVCCTLMTASMSGIAMGYNYSLAEYIDLKETNVSVYLKRGVFDDDVSGEMDWRRSGHKPQTGLLRDSNLATSEHDEEEMPRRSGRRLDESVFQSDDHNRFEGSLMKLTAKPPGATTTTEGVTSDVKMAEIIKKYPSDSLDQLKAIHELLNMRKSNEHRATINYDKTTTIGPNINNYFPGARRMMIEPDSPARHNIFVDNRAIPFEHSTFRINPIRTAVPEVGIGQAPNWFLPKGTIPEPYKRAMYTEDYDNVPITAHTYPQPIRYKTGVNRPTRPLPDASSSPRAMAAPNEIPMLKGPDTRRLESSELNRLRDKLLMDKANFPSFQKSGFMQSENEGSDKSEELDYEEEAKRGIKIEKRKKRYIKEINSREVIVKETSYTQYEPRAIFNKYVKIDHDTKSLNQNVIDEFHSVSDQEIVANNVNSNPPEINGSRDNIDSMKRRNKSIFTTKSGDVYNATETKRAQDNLSLRSITAKESTAKLKVNVSTPFRLMPKNETFMARIVKLLSS